MNLDYNVSEVVNVYGKDRIKAIKYLCHTYNLELKEAKRLVDEEHARRAPSKMSFGDYTKETQKQIVQKEFEQQKTKDKIQENKKNAIACCPKCGSTDLSAQKKGFGIGKALIGIAVTGGIGLVAGNISAKKVRVTCLNCGKQFWAGKGK